MLARQSVLQEQEKAQALSATSRMRDLMAKEKINWQDAGYRVAMEDDSLIMNNTFKETYSAGAQMVDPETSERIRKRAELEDFRNKDVMDELLVKRDVFDSIGHDEMVKRMSDSLNNAAFAAEDTEKLREISFANAMRQADEQKRMLDTFDGDPTSSEARMMITGILSDRGVEVGDIKNISAYLKGGEAPLMAFNDHAWQAQAFKTPEERDGYLQAWGKLSSSEPGTPEHREAVKQIDLVTYKHKRDTNVAATVAQQVKQAEEIGKAVGVDLKEMNAEQLQIAKLDPDKIDDIPKMMLSTVTSLITKLEGRISPETAERYKSAIADQLTKIDGSTSPADTLGIARTMTMNLLNEARTEMTAASNIDASTIAAQRVASDLPVVKSREDYDALPDGAQYIGTQGQPLIKGQEPK